MSIQSTGTRNCRTAALAVACIVISSASLAADATTGSTGSGTAGTGTATAGFATTTPTTAPTSSGSLTPGSALEIESEHATTAEQFRRYRSSGAAVTAPKNQRLGTGRSPGEGYYVAPLRPQATTQSAGRERTPAGSEPGRTRRSRLDPNVLACAARFRSFDPETGSYVAANGDVRTCPYLD